MAYQIFLDYFGEPNGVRRLSDQLCIPFAAGNTDYQTYLKYVEEGGEVLPADEPVES